MLPNFVAKGTIDGRSCLRLDGRLVLEEFSALRAGLIAGASRDAAALFAEPVLTQKGDRIEVAWYAEQAGQPQRLDGLDPDIRRIVADKLKQRLEALAPLLSSDLGPLLARALYVAEPADILAIGQDPLLIRWGVLPEGLGADDRPGLDRHFAETIGRYAGFGPPGIASRPTRPVPVRPSVEPVAPPERIDPVATSGAGMFADSRPLLIATLVAACLALLFTLPGILAAPAPALPLDDAALAHAREITKAMRDKVDQAKAALAAANCNPDGTIAPPTKDAQGQLPPQPIPIRQDPSRPQGDMSLVARRATESVVFIFTCVARETWTEQHKADAQKMTPYECPDPERGPAPPGGQTSPADLVVQGHGSGFFIAPGRIATNTHVVEGAKAVFVTNRFLGHMARGKVEAATVKEHADDPDFAVVGVDVERSPPPIELATSSTRLQNVVAAGYPGVITEEDSGRERLFNGDVEAVPELTTYPGFITLTMQKSVPLIFSSAVIGHGNSGGPLLDLCARAIGVNTLGWSGTEGDSGYKINVAESAKALAAFLDQHGIAHKVSDAACDPGQQASNEPAPAGGSPPAGGPLPASGSPSTAPKVK